MNDRVFIVGSCKDVKTYKSDLKGKYKTIITYTNNKALSSDAKKLESGEFVYTSNIFRGLAVSSLDDIVFVNQSKENIKYVKHLLSIYQKFNNYPNFIEV